MRSTSTTGWMRPPSAVAAGRKLTGFLLLVAACRGTRLEPAAPVRMVRPDGTEVTCTRPSQEVLEDREAQSVSPALPDLVHLLLGRGVTTDAKAAGLARAAQTAPALEYLSYRLCLEFGRNVLDEEVYAEWLTRLEPRLRARLAPRSSEPPGATIAPGGGNRAHRSGRPRAAIRGAGPLCMGRVRGPPCSSSPNGSRVGSSGRSHRPARGGTCRPRCR